jgi:hypothetical protein
VKRLRKAQRRVGSSRCPVALVVLLTAAAPSICRGGIIDISEILPDTGFEQRHTFGLHGIDFSQSDAVDPLLPGEVIGPLAFRLTTPDGKFTINYRITASDNGGLPSATVTGTVFNNTAGEGSLFVLLDQRYQPSPIFNNGCLAGGALSGTFTEPAVHGNNILGQGLVAGNAVPALAWADTQGRSFNLFTGPGGLFPSPVDLEAELTYNFGPGSTPGDTITIPFTVSAPAPTPEPSTLALALPGLLAGVGGWWRRRLAVA